MCPTTRTIVRTPREDPPPEKTEASAVGQEATSKGENSIYCRFVDDEQFVEYYDLNSNPYQMNNNYPSLEEWQVQKYERRLQDLLNQGSIDGGD
jgi:hypothetical protein